MNKLIVLFAVLLSVPLTQAADRDLTVAGLLGYGAAENNFSGFTYGVEVDYSLSPFWSAGLYWTLTQKANYSGFGNDYTYMPIMLQANYHPSQLENFFIGPRLGVTSQKFGTNALSYATSDFTVGSQAGYDYPIVLDWTLGLEANWNYILTTTKSSLFNFVVSIRYRF